MTGPDRFVIEEPVLQGQHALVTGGGRGLGAAIAAELARLGARVTICGRDEGRLAWQAAHLRDVLGAEAHAVHCDVADERSVAAAFGSARERFGDPSVLVNNAGQAEGGPFTELERTRWERMLAVNLTGTFLCTREALPAMLAASGGRVINIASTAALRGYAEMAAYCAAKHGVVGLTRALAAETSRTGVTVNAVCPGYADTDMAARAVDALAARRGIEREEALALVTGVSPRGTLVRPEEVAGTVAWLSSPAGASVTGQAIAVAGGEVM